MDTQLRDILRTLAIETNLSDASYVTYFDIVKNWAIQPANVSTFWDRYCRLVTDKTDDNITNLSLGEIIQDKPPVIGIFNFKFHIEENEDAWEPFDDDFLQLVTFIYQKVIADNFRICNETETELLAVILESSDNWFITEGESNYLMLQLRIQFPYAKIDLKIQNQIIRPKVINLLRNHSVTSKMSRQPIGDWDRILIPTPKNIPMYGSSEGSNIPKLKISHIWPRITDGDLTEDNIQEDIDFSEAFIPHNHINVQQRLIDPDIFKDLSVDWTPVFLSVNYCPQVLLQKESTPNRTMVVDFSRKEYSRADIAEQMAEMIAPERYNKKSSWLEIGKAFYSAYESNDKGLHSWIYSTKEVFKGIEGLPSFFEGGIEETCKEWYATFAGTPITEKTLAWYAQQDNPNIYKDWHKNWCLTAIDTAISSLHTDVAVALYRTYWLEYIYCAVGAVGKWYRFNGYRWVEDYHGLTLSKEISSGFVKKFEGIRTLLSRQILESNNEDFRAKGEETMKRISGLIAKLKTGPYKGSILKEAREYFYVNDFIRTLDTNHCLLGLSNGVLEACDDHILFRSSKPEDYISMCTRIPYIVYSWDHPKVKEVMEWMKQTFPDQELLHYFLKFAASCIKGKNSDKIFPIFTGEGDNSKSMIVKLFEAVFGSYCIKMQVSMLSEKAANSSGPSPQLARSKGTRLVFFDEAEDDTVIHKGLVKRMTGGDSFFARMLQDNGLDIEATYKMALSTNGVPGFHRPDKAIKSRVKFFPFLSTWKADAPDSIEEQNRLRIYKMDPFFERKIPFLAQPFLWIMCQYYPIYIAEKLKTPKIVIEHTEQYWNDSDIFSQYIYDNITQMYDKKGQPDINFKVSIKEIHDSMKIWFRDCFPGEKLPTRAEIKSQLSSKWERPKNGYWYGITINSSQEENDMTNLLGGKSVSKEQIEKEISLTLEKASQQFS